MKHQTITGKKLTDIRKAKGLTQKEVARRAKISIAKLSDLEHHYFGNITVLDMVKLLDFYNVSVGEVYEINLSVALTAAEMEARKGILLREGIINEPAQVIQHSN